MVRSAERRLPSAVRKKLEQRLDELERDTIPVLEVELSTTPGLDAAAFLAAARRERERILDAFRDAQEAAPGEWNPRYIEVGDTVTINEIGTRAVERYTIVPIEARSALDDGWISSASPLGSSLLGRAPGDVVDVRTPDGVRRYRIHDFEEA